jgi:hypothetical protein
MKIFTENVFSTILKMLGGAKFRREMRKIEKITEDDPELKTSLKDLAQRRKEVEERMARFCKRNPTHEWCTTKGVSRVKVNR